MSSDLSTRNGLIDGLRGLSVSLVILGHLTFNRIGSQLPYVPMREFVARTDADAWSWLVFLYHRMARDFFGPLAAAGVSIFFVISGFLITSLLVAEERRYGRISIKAFYIRRTFRILPAFYALLAALLVLAYAGVIRMPLVDVLRSALFTCNLTACAWWVGHTWSLAVEEQFYLAWPLIFLTAPRRRARIILWLALLLPLASIYVEAVAGFGFIAVGALAAVRPDLHTRAMQGARDVWVWASIVFVLGAPLTGLLPGGQGVTRVSLPWVIGFLVFATLKGAGPIHAIARLRWLQAVGVVSYSLYLWQQLSLGPATRGGEVIVGDLYREAGAVTTVAFVVPALLVYWLLEKPLTVYGRALSARMLARRREADGALIQPVT